MWKQIVADMKKLKTLNLRAAEVSKLIVDTEEKMGADAGKALSPCAASRP